MQTVLKGSNSSRSCSITPVAFATVLALLGGVSLTIGVVFAALGAWLVLPFAGLEVVALAAAFRVYARRAADWERIEIGAGRLQQAVWARRRDEPKTGVKGEGRR